MDIRFLESIVSNLKSIDDYKNLSACLPEIASIKLQFYLLKVVTTSFGKRILRLFDDELYYTIFEGRQKIIDSAKSGIFTEFYPNGKVKTVVLKINGIRQGRTTIWYDNGAIQTTGEYQDGNKVGTWSLLDRNGNLISNYKYK